MTILDRPPKGWKRPAMPDRVKIQAVINAFLTAFKVPFCDALDVHFDHRPGLWERKFDTETGDTIPPANDPDYIEAITKEDHDKRTNGPGGEKRITSAGSDTHRRAKGVRADKDHKEFVERVLTKRCGAKRKPTGNWKSGRKLQSRNDLKRR